MRFMHQVFVTLFCRRDHFYDFPCSLIFKQCAVFVVIVLMGYAALYPSYACLRAIVRPYALFQKCFQSISLIDFSQRQSIQFSRKIKYASVLQGHL